MTARRPSKWIPPLKALVMERVDLEKYAIFLFGSRVKDPDKPYGDVDIGILGNEPLPIDTLYELNEALEESSVPLAVDFVDFYQIDRSPKPAQIYSHLNKSIQCFG